MVTLKSAFISNGTIRFINGEDAVPTTSEVRGNTTYNTIGRPAVPASFEVEFRVHSTFDVDGMDCQPYISITVPVAITDKKAGFLDIEDQAVSAVAIMLRETADEIDKQTEELNRARAEESAAAAALE